MRDTLIADGPLAHDDLASVQTALQRTGGTDPDELAHTDRGERLER